MITSEGVKFWLLVDLVDEDLARDRKVGVASGEGPGMLGEGNSDNLAEGGPDTVGDVALR